MPKPKKGPRFGGSPSHHKHIVGNLATELFRHGRIETTLARAKTVQPLADRMVTFAKRGDLHARRQVHQVIRDRDVAHKLFADVGPAFADRQGGYTRVLKTGSRKGDHAPMALIELVEAADATDDTALSEAPRRRWSLRRRRGTVSQGAQVREEELAAADDRGEDVDASLMGDPSADDEAAPDAPTLADDGTVGADPAEVEARLAEADASDEADAGEADAGESDADEADADPDDSR